MKVNFSKSNAFTSNQAITKNALKRFNVHILDNGEHSMSMMHFADAIMGKKDYINLSLNKVDINEEKYGVKFIDSIEKVLKSLDLKSGDYVSIPALASTKLYSLRNAIAQVLKLDVKFNVLDLKKYKETFLKLFKAFYMNKDALEAELSSIDPLEQNYDRIFPLINYINELASKGVNVYIPSHPNNYPVKGMLKDLGINMDFLYHYIAKGVDKTGMLEDIIFQAKNSENYDFNLLALSDAHVVDAANLAGETYIYGSEDNFVTDKARGVYNFCPVRDVNGILKGFSFHDETTVEYKAEEFPGLNYISPLLNFVGLNIRDLKASEEENAMLKDFIRKRKDVSELPNKLYNLKEIFSEKEIDYGNLNLLGNFVNKTRELIFDVNNEEKILFQKNNCEGSQRPSVVSMWGPCFSTIKAISDDIEENI